MLLVTGHLRNVGHSASYTRDEPFAIQAEDVLAGIEGNAKPPTSVAEAAARLGVLLAAKWSQRERRIISLEEWKHGYVAA